MAPLWWTSSRLSQSEVEPWQTARLRWLMTEVLNRCHSLVQLVQMSVSEQHKCYVIVVQLQYHNVTQYCLVFQAFPSSPSLHLGSSQTLATQNRKTRANLAENGQGRSAPAQFWPGVGKATRLGYMAYTRGGGYVFLTSSDMMASNRRVAGILKQVQKYTSSKSNKITLKSESYHYSFIIIFLCPCPAFALIVITRDRSILLTQCKWSGNHRK